MLSFEEFKDKKHIILDKAIETFIFNRVNDEQWAVYSITKEFGDFSCYVYDEHQAYIQYKGRMESFGYGRFPIVIE